MVHVICMRRHILPGQFWSLPLGEQLFLQASVEFELESEKELIESIRKTGEK